MRTKSNNAAQEGKMNVYEMVTRRILDQMVSGNIPWRDVLLPKRKGRSTHYNPFTGTNYSLLNRLLLGEPGEYSTWNQIKEHGGNVREGAKSKIVTYWCVFIPQSKKKEAEQLEAEGKSIEHLKMQTLKYYRVFNLRDVDGLKRKAEEPVPETVESEDPTLVADMVISDYRHNQGVTLADSSSDESAYDMTTDTVTVPKKERFAYEEDWFASIFSKLVNSTATEKRLNRAAELKKMQEGETSVKEELICEIGSSMILTACGLKRKETHEQLAAECQHWIEAMNNDFKLIVFASSGAEKAADYVLGDFAETEEAA